MTKIDMDSWLVDNDLLLRKAAVPFRKKGIEYEDLMQEARLAACIAVTQYREDSGWSLNSFVFERVRYHLLDLVKKRAKDFERTCTLEDHNIHALIEARMCCDRCRSPVEDEVIGRQLVDYVLVVMSSACVKNQDQKIFLQYVSGLSAVKIAASNNASERGVRKKIKRTSQALMQQVGKDWCCA